MNAGLRTHKQASCRVEVPTGIPDHLQNTVRELVGIESTNPRKGHATALLHQVCAEADQHIKVLMLHVEPFDDGLSIEQLEKFYGKFGFMVAGREPVLIMVRAPECSALVRAH